MRGRNRDREKMIKRLTKEELDRQTDRVSCKIGRETQTDIDNFKIERERERKIEIRPVQKMKCT